MRKGRERRRYMGSPPRWSWSLEHRWKDRVWEEVMTPFEPC